MRISVSMLVFALAVGSIAAQSPGPQVKEKDKPKVDKPVKLPPSPLDKVEGYKRQIIEGFTVMVTPEAAEGEIKDGELKLLDALAGEFRLMKKVMPAKQVELLQKVTIWVDWDEYQALSNGREGRALAVYQTGTAQSLLAEKKNPYTAKCVHVYSLKMLAEEHQPKRDSHRLVMLHEFAHAVHDQLLTFGHAGIKTAYKQAMERKLYDKAQYVSTNEKEFFAEITCGYYDQLHHYPKTRDDLKKHDPVTHQLMESIWGTAKKPVKATIAAAPAKPKTPDETSDADQYDSKIALGDIKLGATAHGPEFKAEDAKDAVVILANFGGGELIILEKLAKMHTELAPYGAKIVAVHSFVAEPGAVKKIFSDRDVAYTGLDKAFFPGKDGKLHSEKPAHTIIFDALGKCVFRGDGYDATPHACGAVGKMLVAKAIKGETPKALVPIVVSIVLGAVPILDQVPKIATLTVSADADTAAAAKALAAVILAPAQALLVEAQTNVKTDPLAAYITAEKIPLTYKGTSVTAKAMALMEQLKLNPAVAKELKARKLFDPIKKLDQHLMSQPGSFVPLDDKFQKPNKAAIDQMVALNAQLKKAHPSALCTAEAAKMTAKYSLGE